MALEWSCSWLDSTLPRLGILVFFEIFVGVGKEAFVIGSQVVLKKIDNVEKPPEIDILLPSTSKNRLVTRRVICLELRYVEMRDFGIADTRIQGDRGQAKLDSIDEGAFYACGDDSAHVANLVHVFVKVGTEDRVDDIDVGSSVSAGEKIIDELKVEAMENQVSLVIVGLPGIRLCKACVSNAIWIKDLARALPRIRLLSMFKQFFCCFFWISRVSASIKPPCLPKSKQVHFFETSRLYAYFLTTSSIAAPGTLSNVRSNRFFHTMLVIDARVSSQRRA